MSAVRFGHRYHRFSLDQRAVPGGGPPASYKPHFLHPVLVHLCSVCVTQFLLGLLLPKDFMNVSACVDCNTSEWHSPRWAATSFSLNVSKFVQEATGHIRVRNSSLIMSERNESKEPHQCACRTPFVPAPHVRGARLCIVHIA